jgi:hypothetical protein
MDTQDIFQHAVDNGDHAIVDEDGNLDGKKKRYQERYLFREKITLTDGREARVDVSVYVYPNPIEAKKRKLQQKISQLQAELEQEESA